jgi:hypothetical protein
LTGPGRDTTPPEPVELDASPPEYLVAERRIFGLPPSAPVASLAAVCLVAALALLATGSLALGLLLLAAALLLAALFLEQARRRRATRVDRAAAEATDNMRGLARFAGASVRVWAGSSRESASLRLEVRRLVRERTRLQLELGAAAYAGDDAETENLRARLRSLDARIARCRRDAGAALERARRRTSQERLAVSSTEIRRP